MTKKTNNSNAFDQTELENQPVPKEKLPYVKPELHNRSLDGTEGKIPSTGEFTVTITVGSTTKYGS